MHRRALPLLTLTALLAAASLPGPGRAVEPALYEGLEYRLVGPWRGGRVTTVTGVADDPRRYYMGAAGGGVWKTGNAGVTWQNISDGQIPVGTIGAVAVATSDPNVLYVGTGESPIRGVTTSQGEGVWKSTDAGRSFRFLGLPKAGQISKIEIHPEDPDLVYVAAQGQIWSPNPERGVYRSRDGGETWEQVLAVNPDTGASDLAMDPTNPRILYAGLWHHGRKPWFIKSGGEGGGIYRSKDGGDSWEKLAGGLPDLVGKIGVDVSASRPSRIYAIIEAEPGRGGLWRSDDHGETWQLMNGHRVLHSRAWYYNHVTADPLDPDTVWVLNVPLMKSVDGGVSWEKIDTPHGDHHDHWINPRDNRIMINGNDGGATISFDGGETWSSIDNQPTAQLYRLITDRQTPWRLYAGQQDNSTLSIAAWAWDGGIGREDFYPVGGGESAHIAFDPDDPRLIYATTINGTLTEYDHATGRVRAIIPYPERVFGMDSRDLRYRANWNPPVITSPHDRSTIYYGTQMLLRSRDRGLSWEEISPDLTRADPERMGRNGGPLTPENVGAEFYHTIFYLAESEHEEGSIWVGTDDGLVHLTRDGGESWADISPPHPGEAMINAIELSPHQDGQAYLAVTGYKLNDFAPYIYVTADHGQRWRRIDAGLPEDAFVRVVREDPIRPGLLYAGTEKGLFVSFDAGGSWQSLDLNLPAVPITDLRARTDGLAVATQGRSLWVLDDLFVLRQAAQAEAGEALHLYTPPPTFMGRPGSRAGATEGSNPPPGAPLYYHLAEPPGPGAVLEIEIRDAAGALVRTMSSEESDQDRCELGNMDPRRPFEIEHPPLAAGLNRWWWDLRWEDIGCIDDILLHDGYSGPSVAPGSYTASISLGAASATVPLEVLADPRNEATPAQTAAWSATLLEVRALLEEALGSLDRARQARAQLRALAEREDDPALAALTAEAVAAIDDWESKVTQLRHETFEDEDAWENMIDGQLRFLMDVIDRSGPPVTAGARERLADLAERWEALESALEDIASARIAPVNAWAREHDIPHVIAVRP